MSMVSSSASSRVSCGSSFAAATAAITFRRWSAFCKIPYERPCEVDVPPLRGRSGLSSLNASCELPGPTGAGAKPGA